MSFFAIGAGLGTKNSDNQWLEVFFPKPELNPDKDLIGKIALLTGYKGGNATIELDAPTCHALEELFVKEHASFHALTLAAMECSAQPKVLVILEEDSQTETVPETYLKLHLLSHRKCKPHQINLDNIFSLLPTVAWTSKGAVDLNELPERQLLFRSRGEHLQIYSVDKFPQMTNYVIPEGLRIADTARVRLGAYLGSGTTIMHEGFVNFNAGTEGPNMIEGRISAGVFVGAGSDLGGGCSTMGILSGGNDAVIAVGKHCLIGANAGIGISLGNNCTVEAGLYITAGAKVTMLNTKKKQNVKARELSGKNDLLFRRNSQTGEIECLQNKSAIQLNESLHSNN